jgi:twitching motility two-component system response regulator PilG
MKHTALTEESLAAVEDSGPGPLESAAPGAITKVLVVDDSVTIRRTAESLLKREGYHAETAEDGFEALSKIVDWSPDIIFLDIMMPRLDGYQTCAVIKNNNEFAATPVIMLSSKDGIFDRARGALVGSEQYVTKPFTREELLEAIHRQLPAARTAP